MRDNILIFLTVIGVVYTQNAAGAPYKPLPTSPPPLVIGQPCEAEVYSKKPKSTLARQVSKEMMADFLSSPDEVSIRGVPDFSKGKVVGLKILSIRPGSFYEAIGLDRGDTLLELNGRELEVKSGFEAFNGLAKKGKGTVKVLRGCDPILIQIN